MKRALFIGLLAAAGCEFNEHLGDPIGPGAYPNGGGTFGGAGGGSFGTGGGTGAGGGGNTDACGGCNKPSECWTSTSGGYELWTYAGSCDPTFQTCDYAKQVSLCPEDCQAGACVPGPSCTLSTNCSPPLDCKLASSGALRCMGTDLVTEGKPCNESVVGSRCWNHLVCVHPSYESSSVCAQLCQNDNDCFGAQGLRNLGVCSFSLSLPGGFGFCE